MALELGARHHTVVAPEERRAQRQVHPQERRAGRKADRGAFLEPYLNEKTYAVVDELEKPSPRRTTATVARVALAWVQAQPGVSSTIIGARRLAQLEDNVKALDVTLTKEELGRLDARTKPTFGFPQSMEPWFPSIHNGGTTVNGVSSAPSPFVMEKGGKPY